MTRMPSASTRSTTAGTGRAGRRNAVGCSSGVILLARCGPARHGLTRTGLLATAVVAVAVAVAGLVVVQRDVSGRRGSGLPGAFDYDLAAVATIDPAHIAYCQTGAVPLAIQQPRGLAVDEADRIYVAGDRRVVVFAPNGTQASQYDLDEEPRCLAVAGSEHGFPGRLYVGAKSRVLVLDPSGNKVAAWDDLGPTAVLTSLAVADHEVLVADAGNRIVLRYDPVGKVLGQIGRRDPAKHRLGFVIPSPYFDLAMGADGLVRVVNPGAHRIEAYTLEGDLELWWGRRSEAVDGFCGCCNPTHIALLPDGRFVTSEKGIPRVKIYTADGQFACVVAGPETLAHAAAALEETRPDHKLPVFDVAADRRGRILVLDPRERVVRIFEPKAQQ